MRRIFICLLVVSGCAGGLADVPTDPEPSAPDRMKELAFYVGDWSCVGRDLTTAEKSPLTVKVRPVLGGKWLSVRVYRDGVQVTDEFKGYDAERKRWVHLWVAGEASGLLSAGDWEGNRMVSLAEIPALPRSRATFTKLSETSYSHVTDEDTGKGFQRVFEKTCRKQS